MSFFLPKHTFKLLGLSLSLVSAFAACSPTLNSPAARPVLTAQATPKNLPWFPTQQGYRWDYDVSIAPVMDPDAIDKGTYHLSVDRVAPSANGDLIELRGLSGFNNRYTFPSLIQNPQGVTLQDMTFLGIGSDEVKGLQIPLIKMPLQVGQRWETNEWLAKVKGPETITVPAGRFETMKIEVIGTFEHEYTAVGDYWFSPGKGLIKAVYTVPDFHVEMLLTQTGLKRP